MLYNQHDDECEVHINGVKATDIKGTSSEQAVVIMKQTERKAMVANSINLIAIYCHQGGGQFTNAGISLMSFDEPVTYARFHHSLIKHLPV